jgi:hypothetical protein
MIGAVLLRPPYVLLAWTGTPLRLLYTAEMALDCVRSVETWEGRSCSQHPTRPAYAKFEASSINSPTIRQFSSAISLIQLILTLQRW